MTYVYPTPQGTMIAGQHSDDNSLTGPPKVNRTYFQWGATISEDAQIRNDHAQGRVPWVSFKPPTGGIAAILNGSQDDAIAARGDRYATYAKPVIATFFHEPVGDVQPEDFWAAFYHVREVMRFGSRGGRNQATFAPILNGYIYENWYNPVSNPKGSLEDWVAPGVNLRMFGFDHYGTPDELGRMFDDLRARMPSGGHVAIGEFGRVEPPDGAPQGGASGFRAKLDLFRSQVGFLNVCCYFNSRVQVLEAGSQELADWRAFLQEFDG